MLHLALDFLNDEVNSYINRHTGSDEIGSALSPIINASGQYAFEENSLAISLIRLEEERIFREQRPTSTLRGGALVTRPPRLKLVLHVMFAAHFKLHQQALRYLSFVLTCFQSNSSFTSDTHPGLDPRIQKLKVELLSLTYEEMNQIWAYLGGKYIPSAVYKVHLIALQDDVEHTASRVLNIEGEVQPQ